MATTKLLLVKDVDHLGRSGDIVKVRAGFARNLLLPNGAGIVANNKTVGMQASLQEKRKQLAIVEKQESEQLAARLQGTSVSTIVKVDHEGHMYGSVSAADIGHLIQNQLGIELDKKAVQLKTIKKTGTHQVSIQLKEGVVAQIEVIVTPEETEETKTK